MRIAGIYSFKNGREEVSTRYPQLLEEVKTIIETVDADQYKTKISEEKTMAGRLLFDPSSLNKAFKAEFFKSGWKPTRVSCDYPTTYYLEDYTLRSSNKGAFREWIL